MNEEYRQISLFRDLTENFKIDKPIRLIELFAGIGSQAMALRDLGADFVSWRAVEIDRFAMESYNAIHGTDYEVSDIKNIHAADLGIVERGRYCYLMTYSFPCQDLSNAGLRKGMEKGSGTRSGLLWEVERILTECGDERPQVLLMENVPAVHNRKNAADFEKWRLSLESMGYRNYWKDLNAKDYGVAQSRNRCFMVSILGDERPYIFPEPWSLDKTVADYLEDEVEEKFYIRTERARKLIAQLLDRSALPEAAFERNKACVDGTTAGGGREGDRQCGVRQGQVDCLKAERRNGGRGKEQQAVSMNLKGIEKPESVARAVLAAYGEKGMGAGRIMSNGVIEKHGRSD